MTVAELIEKLNELPDELRRLPVHVQTENEGGEASEVRAALSSGSGMWWQADQVIISARY